MKIGIIGAGNMGSAFAKRLAAAGHEVNITARHVSHAEQAASAAQSSVRAVPARQVAEDTDVLIVATPFGQVLGGDGGSQNVQVFTTFNIHLGYMAGRGTSVAPRRDSVEP